MQVPRLFIKLRVPGRSFSHYLVNVHTKHTLNELEKSTNNKVTMTKSSYIHTLLLDIRMADFRLWLLAPNS